MQNVGRAPDTKERVIELDSGQVVRIRKWSMRKSLSMGRVISELFQNLMAELRDLKRSQYEEAVAEAKAEGLAEGDDGWPDAVEYEEATQAELMGVIPEIMERASENFALLIAESIVSTDGARKWDQDAVLDEMTFTDIPDVIEAVIELNFAGDSVGKWRRLLSGEAFRKPKGTKKKRRK